MCEGAASPRYGRVSDLSRAFDTIRRDKLIDVLSTFLGESELRMFTSFLRHVSRNTPVIRRLPRICNNDRHSASPVLFTVYLEAVLRDLRLLLPTRPPSVYNLPLNVDYADDIDFISSSHSHLDASRQHAWQSAH